MQINMTDDQLRELLIEALFEKISPEDRKAMITGALKTLMEPQKTPYGRSEASRMQDAVETALLRIATVVIAEELDKTEVKDQLRALAAEAIQKVFATDTRDQTTTVMARAMVSAMLRNN